MEARTPSAPYVIGEPLPGHQAVLHTSGRFHAELNWRAIDRSCSLSPEGLQPRALTFAEVASGPELRVPLGSEAELPLARAAIHFAYTRQLAVGSVQEALGLRERAAYLGVRGCAEACTRLILRALNGERVVSVGAASSPKTPAAASSTLLCGTAGEGAGAETAGAHDCCGGGDFMGSGPEVPPYLEVFACSHLWFDLPEDPRFAAVLRTARDQLLWRFPNAPAVLNDDSGGLLEAALALPAAAVEALLSSDEFGTDGEASVLLLLAEWMRANYEFTDAATREKLCRQVRLVQLSPPYLTTVLPALALEYESVSGSGEDKQAREHGGQGAGSSPSAASAWFPISVAEAAFIARLAAAPPAEREALMSSEACVESRPAAFDHGSPWYSPAPRRQCLPPHGRAFEWRVPQKQLRRALEGLQPGCYRSVGVTLGEGEDAEDAEQEEEEEETDHSEEEGAAGGIIVSDGLDLWPSLHVSNDAASCALELFVLLPTVFGHLRDSAGAAVGEARVAEAAAVMAEASALASASPALASRRVCDSGVAAGRQTPAVEVAACLSMFRRQGAGQAAEAASGCVSGGGGGGGGGSACGAGGSISCGGREGSRVVLGRSLKRRLWPLKRQREIEGEGEGEGEEERERVRQEEVREAGEGSRCDKLAAFGPFLQDGQLCGSLRIWPPPGR